MSTRDDVHRLVDQLDEAALPDAARQLTALTQRDRASATDADTEAAVVELRRRLPWIGSLHSGRGDLAERSAQILRDELGTRQQ
jgi:glycosyltransferase A (GT-A) superfamily protein (DUF2064 family)